MEEEDFVPLSALQHYRYCPRQCALIHVERLWAENRQTAEGRLLHARTDAPLTEQRHGVRTVTAMPLKEAPLGLWGVADVVEFHATATGAIPYPVEYKRGRPKSHRADEVQLCAQALCLEAMLGQRITEGALYYGAARRRQVVHFDQCLRQLTIDTCRSVHDLMRTGRTPTATYESQRCDACSLLELCRPRLLAQRHHVQDWLRQSVLTED